MVDDSAPLRERLVARLTSSGTVTIVGEAGTVSEAIAGFRNTQPEVVVLDIHMPGGSGFDVLRVIKKERPSTIVIMLTNQSCTPFRWRSRLMGADFLFDKTTEFEKVADVIQSTHKEGNNL
jgi:two-component system, NarL family, response regulator DevR